MAYIAMYRKFRPDTFSEVKGQDAVVTTLKNQIISGRVGHAYLFCGTRGTGKTTVAKLLARAINCEHPIDGAPCNTCSTCKAILNGTSMNVVEIDAASNNGVESVREIIDEVKYSPTEGRYRVYIIDEVHMLSAGAFNALLKTLEEPPSYVVFIMATTEAHKIPITILSRCQRYDFKRISLETIADRLMDLCQREGIETEEKAMRYVAKAADGSMRDALSLLERCAAFYYGQVLTYDRVLEVLGTVDVEVFSLMLRYVYERKAAESLRLLDEMVTAGRELTRFVVDFTWYLRNLILAKSGEDMSEMLGISSEQMALLAHEATVFPEEELTRYISILCELTNQLRYATQKRILIEMTFVRLCRPQMDVEEPAVLSRIRQLEEEVEDLQQNGVARSVTQQETAPEQDMPPEALVKALPEDLQQVAEQWESIKGRCAQLMRNVLESSIPSITENGHLLLVFEHDTDYDMMSAEEKLAELSKVIADCIQKEVVVEVKRLGEGEQKKQYADITVLNKRLKNIKIEMIS